MEQAPVRLFYVAGIVAASLAVFAGSLSYGIGIRSHQAASVTARPQEQVHTAQQAPDALRPAAPRTAGKTPMTAPAAAPPAKPVQPAPPAQSVQPAPKSTTHLAQPGETLSLIAWLYGVEPAAIRTANGLGSDRIQAGQPLKIPGAQALRRHTVAQGDTLWQVAVRYGVDFEDLLAANGSIDAGELQIGQQLVIPAQSTATPVTASVGEEESVAAFAGMFAWPLVAPVSSPFGPRWGKMHSGVDLAATAGEPIKAAREGEVLIAGEVPGYGKTVILRHSDSTRTLYAHASKLMVRSGQKVKRGEVIALVGSTGHSTGPHLHFEIIVNNQPLDPLVLLPHK